MIFGIIAPVIFVATDLVASIITNKYSFISQSMNELHARGTSTRPYIVVLNIFVYLMFLLFALEILKNANDNWALKVIGFLVMSFVFFNFVGLFFPMRLGELPSKINVIIGALGVFSLVLAIPLGAFAFDNWMRVLSVVIVIVFILLTIIGLWIVPRFTSSSAPTIGIQERVMMYIVFVWIISLAITLGNAKAIQG